MQNLKRKLSDNFTLIEFLRSSTAERHPDILDAQYDPPSEVVDNLSYLCNQTLQPIREGLGAPLKITSGYRSQKLNKLVGGSDRSQHSIGQAADVQLSDSFLTEPKYADIKNKIEEQVYSLTGKTVRSDVNANYYLFAYVCINLDDLDIDQVIHEYGLGLGQPGWVHLASSKGDRDKRQILALGRYLENKKDLPDLVGALNYGT